MTGRECHYGCGKTTDLRPYGPGGAWTCFDCMRATPEREREAKARYGALLDANEAVSTTGAVVIGEEQGPRPLESRDLPDDDGGES